MKMRSYEDWIDLHWQRELTPEEILDWHSFLSTHPELASKWELDQQLLKSVRSLADIPLSNNFTARVLRSAENVRLDFGEKMTIRESFVDSWWSRFWAHPGIRIAGISALLLTGIGLWQWDPNAVNLVESITTITEAETVPSVEELQDFDAIHGLAQSASDVDWELVLAMD
ncbi:MAG: hypothetical protein HOH33_01715 [Verrucomicrobia bacterium]|jgi:hypothetical protein|nr:hypothetical protein [Verrucomicrobiota bacterium]